jgi:hypothetical protein
VERPDSLETALDEALDALVAGDAEAVRRVRQRYGNAPELAGLVDAAGRIRGALAATPSPQVQARHLDLIRKAAGRAAEGSPRSLFALRRPRFVRTWVFRPALVLGLLLLLATPAALALSARALPGDPLYSAKLAIENVRLAMPQDPEKSVDLHVEFAQRRMEELSQLSGHGLPAEAALKPMLSSLQDHQEEAAKGVASLKEEGRSVGVLEERLAVSLQKNTARLVEIRSDTGCNPDGSDPRCHVIAIAVTTSEQTLRHVDEGPAALPENQASAPPVTPGGRGGGGQGSSGQEGGQQPGAQAGPPQAPGSQGSQGSQGSLGSQGSQGGQAAPGGGQDQSGAGSGSQASPAPSQSPSSTRGRGGRPRPSTPPVQAPGEIPPAAAQPLQVQVDIKPFDTTNSIDVLNRRDLPVVVRSSPDFDASTLVPSSICFGDDPTDPANSDCGGQSRLVDLDGDGRKDLLLVFRMDRTGIDSGDTEACLTGRTTTGQTVKGCDKVSVVTVTPSSAPTGSEGTTPSPPSGQTAPRSRRIVGP